MALTPEQVKELKEQLKSQVSNLPEDQKAAALEQINAMSPQALETMLNQQSASQSQAPADGQKSIFRMIIAKQVDSKIISENSDAMAVLDINPISKGHLMIIPKKAVKTPKEIPKPVFQLAEQLSRKIVDNLGAKETKAETSQQFGEAIIHLIPIYPDSPNLTLKSERKKASPEELSATEKELKKEVIKMDKKPVEVIKKTKKKSQKSEVIKLQRKVP